MTYDEFVVARLRPLLRYAVMLSGDPHLAEDLVQDTMARVQLKWHRVASADVPELYVKRMLTNAFLDARRGSWLSRVVLRAEPDERAAVAADPADTMADRDQLWRLLARLPSRQRAALVLRYYEDLADKDIAEVLDCAIGTVRASISRALATLRTWTTEDANPDAGPYVLAPVGGGPPATSHVGASSTSLVSGGEA